MATLRVCGENAVHTAVKFLAAFVGGGGGNLAVTSAAGAALAYTSGTTTLSEPSAILASLAPAHLMGTTPMEKAEVIECLSAFQPPGSPALLKTLEGRLESRSYVAGPRLTVADALAVYTATPILQGVPALTAFPEIVRWLRQVGAEAPGVHKGESAPAPLPLPAAPTLKAILEAAAAAASAPVQAVGGEPCAGGAAAAAATAAAAPPAGAPAKKEKEKKAPPPPAAPVEERSPLSEMDFGVGQIVQAWPHPESDKLWCEKVAFGEGQEVREIASGLRAHFTQEQMTGQRVIVVRNLKSRKLAGFASNGMVLCATGEDGKVEFIEPPAGAALGERVTFEGHPGAAAEPNRVDKKKLFEAVAPGLKLVAGVATWEGIPFNTTAGPCKAVTLQAGPVK